MFKNVGMVDRFIRLIAAAVFLYVGLFIYTGTAIGIGFDVAGGLALLTGLVGSCALYSFLSINTRQNDSSSQV